MCGRVCWVLCVLGIDRFVCASLLFCFVWGRVVGLRRLSYGRCLVVCPPFEGTVVWRLRPHCEGRLLWCTDGSPLCGDVCCGDPL